MTEALKHEDNAAEALMGEIVDEFLNRVDRGERPEAEEYVRRYPQLATVLRQMLPALGLLRGSAADCSAEAAPTGTAGDLAGELASGRWAPGKRSSADPQPTGPYTPPGIGPQAPSADTATLAAAAVSTEHSTRNPAFFRTAANLGARAAEA